MIMHKILAYVVFFNCFPDLVDYYQENNMGGLSYPQSYPLGGMQYGYPPQPGQGRVNVWVSPDDRYCQCVKKGAAFEQLVIAMLLVLHLVFVF